MIASPWLLVVGVSPGAVTSATLRSVPAGTSLSTRTVIVIEMELPTASGATGHVMTPAAAAQPFVALTNVVCGGSVSVMVPWAFACVPWFWITIVYVSRSPGAAWAWSTTLTRLKSEWARASAGTARRPLMAISSTSTRRIRRLGIRCIVVSWFCSSGRPAAGNLETLAIPLPCAGPEDSADPGRFPTR